MHISGPNRIFCIARSISMNDKAISANDEFCQRMNNGEDIVYHEKLCKGGYLIVDGGYNKCQWLLGPFSHTVSLQERV